MKERTTRKPGHKYLPREMAGIAARALEVFPVVVITGMRQAGKSTLLEEDPRFDDRSYITLDDLATLSMIGENPDNVLRSYEKLSIDEAQRAKHIFLALKKEVDRDRRPGRFLLSGSANLALMKGVGESLAGRALYLNLRPFSRRELSGATNEPAFLLSFFDRPGLPRSNRGGDAPPITDSEVMSGGLPPVALGEEKDATLWFRGYEQTYLERDLRDFAAVENIMGFRDLLKLAALRTASLLNQSELGRDARLDNRTASRYLGLMEASFVIHRLQPFVRNRSARVIKTPKLYVSDSGLACHLCGCRDLAGDPLRGSLYETYVLQNILSLSELSEEGIEVLFWRTHSGQEADIVLERGRDIMAVEIKSGESFTGRDLKGLKAFLDATPGCKAGVLAYNGTEALKVGDRLWALPLSMLLS